MKIFGLYISTTKKLKTQTADLERLREIEKKYIRLTDRDEKGRFKK